ncbi:17082_t:CDS:2, partial [Funneliformis geosporum]
KIIRDYPVIHGISMQTGSAFLGTEDHDIAYMELHLRDFKSLGLFFSPQIFESRFESYYQNEDYSSLSRNLNPGEMLDHLVDRIDDGYDGCKDKFD